MASQDKLRAMFNEMNFEQKGNFIKTLEKSLEGSDDLDSLQFLDECKGHYTMEKDYMDSLKEEEAEEIVTDDTSPELESVPEEEPEPESESEPEEEFEPESESEPEEEAELEPEFVPEEEVELEPEFMPDEEFESEPESEEEVEPEPIQEFEIVEAPQAVPIIAKSKVDFIEMEISELANNIRHKMRVIETISHLLSDKGSEIMETIVQANDLDYELPLDSTKAYEEKVESTELCLSDFAESIRRDIKVIEAISNLLSGS